MVVDGEVERERFLFSLNFQFRREHFYLGNPELSVQDTRRTYNLVPFYVCTPVLTVACKHHLSSLCRFPYPLLLLYSSLSL